MSPGVVMSHAAAGGVIGGLIGSGVDNAGFFGVEARSFGERVKNGVRKGLIILGGAVGIGSSEIPPAPPPEEKKRKAKEEQVDDKKGSGAD